MALATDLQDTEDRPVPSSIARDRSLQSSLFVLFEIKQSIFGIQVAFFKEIRHYFSIFLAFNGNF